MRNILMGVAAVALAAGGAYAQPGNGNGNGGNNGNGGGNNAAKAHGNGKAGNANANRGNGHSGKGNTGNGNSGNANTGNGNERNGNAGKVRASTNGNSKSNGNGPNGNLRAADRGNNGVGNAGNGNKGKSANDDRARVLRADSDLFRYSVRNATARDYGLIEGCPPGLAKKNNGCNPPGLVKRDYYDYERSSWWGLPGLTSGRYRYYDNNLVRLSDVGAVLGYYPLMGGALAPGNVWPTWFDSDPAPRYYESFYNLGRGGSYRYADNTFYRVNPETSAITSIAALLTGDTIEVGQPMPMGYSVYNVPYGYRDRYADGPSAHYRYSDGYVYEVDPATQLVSAAIELLM